MQGGVWFSLIDKVYSRKNVWASWCQTAAHKGSPGVEGLTMERYQKDVVSNVYSTRAAVIHLHWQIFPKNGPFIEFSGHCNVPPDAERSIERLSGRLREGTCQPKALRRTYIPKPDGKMRPLGIPTVEDRLVQGAIRHVIAPIFEKQFAPQSDGFRPGKGCQDALRRVDERLKRGHRYVVDADLKSYIDTIPHEKLMDRLGERMADGRVLGLIAAFLKAKIMEDWQAWTPPAGASQGAV